MLNITELYQKIRDAAHWALYITDHFKKFNLDSGIRMYRNFLANIQWILQGLIQNQEQMDELGITVDTSYAMEILQGLLHAQEQKDYILLADLIDMQAYPFLTGLLELVRRDVNGEERSELQPGNWFELNLKALELRDYELANRLRRHHVDAMRGTDGVWRYQSGDTLYYVEPTSVGYETCRVERDGHSFYLHSNKDPYEEARKWLGEFVDEDTKSYHVLGCGLGYAGVTLYWRLMENYPVHIYEADLTMLWLAMKHCRLDEALRGRMHLHYDPKLRQLSEAIGMLGHKLCIHYPSLRMIADPNVRKSYEQFFIQDSSYRNARWLLQGNFDANMRGREAEPERIRIIDELKDHFEKRNVFIIGAGPSLDKNLLLLKEYHDPWSIILATGTVFKKLLGIGIKPDYVIISEANKRVLAQIMGVEQADVPMLMLSTAHHEFMTRYLEKHYLIFQEGYPRAEAMAQKIGAQLFQTGGSVSTTALDVAIRLGAARVIFLGQDLAFTDNLAHATGTSNRVATDVEELLPVKEWHGHGTVYADHKFNIYRSWMERRIRQADCAQVDIINATEGGSYIEGMHHLPLTEVLKLLKKRM